MGVFTSKDTVLMKKPLELPLYLMNIAVYVSLVSKNVRSNFIVGTFFPLLELFKDHKLFLITDVNNTTLPSYFEKIGVTPQPGNALLKKLWIERTITRALKNSNADIFICTENFCSLKATIPQHILLLYPGEIKQSYAKKARSILVVDENIKKEIASKKRIEANKIVVIPAWPNQKYNSIDNDKRELVKSKYTEGKEYFLYSCNLLKQEDLINMLKAFSHFKKRQQSSFKLLLLTNLDPLIEKKLENYKYRMDVVIVDTNEIDEKVAITTAAYALIIPFKTYEAPTTILNAMLAKVPVIATSDSSIEEVFGETILYSTNEIKDIGEKMMQLYKDENLRAELIKKGTDLVVNFTEEKAANELWRSMIKTN